MPLSASTFFLLSGILFAPIFDSKNTINHQIKNIGAGTAPFNGAIWDKFSKYNIQCPFALFGANQVQN